MIIVYEGDWHDKKFMDNKHDGNSLGERWTKYKKLGVTDTVQIVQRGNWE